MSLPLERSSYAKQSIHVHFPTEKYNSDFNLQEVLKLAEQFAQYNGPKLLYERIKDFVSDSHFRANIYESYIELTKEVSTNKDATGHYLDGVNQMDHFCYAKLICDFLKENFDLSPPKK